MDHERALGEIKGAIKKMGKGEIPIMVEGGKDADALHSLGINKEILLIHSGKSISNFCDEIANKYEIAIILTDWDSRGGKLCRSIQKNLKGRTKCITEFRDIFCRFSTTKDVEGLPAYLKTLEERLDEQK